MQTWNTIIQAVGYDTTLADVLGPYGMVAFLAVAGTLFGVTLGVLIRGVLEQLRGPRAAQPPATPTATSDGAQPARPSIVSAG